MSNKANVAMQAVNLWTVKDLTRRNKNSPQVEENKMALLAFMAFSVLPNGIFGHITQKESGVAR
jgi:hypothetical protein